MRISCPRSESFSGFLRSRNFFSVTFPAVCCRIPIAGSPTTYWSVGLRTVYRYRIRGGRHCTSGSDPLGKCRFKSCSDQWSALVRDDLYITKAQGKRLIPVFPSSACLHAHSEEQTDCRLSEGGYRVPLPHPKSSEQRSQSASDPA